MGRLAGFLAGIANVGIFVGALVMAWTLSGAAYAQEAPGGPTTTQISVQGNQRIESDTVRSYMIIREGMTYDPALADASLKRLFETGLFADITMRQEGNRLVVSVVENPIVNRVAFEGNSALKEEDLQKEVQLQPRVVYTRAKVQGDVSR